ncbi:MAG: carboxymuconolactone decarboxylase [Deltaproteobacteria bacterium]|jgi:alkylhydroperoxidase family enzyme|nr:carboxymuconolactone decarboxylase [Deltaproteobacteria bacterium]
MRTDVPRLPKLTEEELDPGLHALRPPGPMLNIFSTLANNPKLMQSWWGFANHVILENSLPARERELVILRVGVLSRSDYEYGQHVVMGRDAGLRDDEIARVSTGPEAEGWSDRERALLRATDEMHADAFASDATWAALDFLSDEQKVDFVFTVGQYMLVSMALNTLGIQLDEGYEGLPAD